MYFQPRLQHQFPGELIGSYGNLQDLYKHMNTQTKVKYINIIVKWWHYIKLNYMKLPISTCF